MEAEWLRVNENRKMKSGETVHIWKGGHWQQEWFLQLLIQDFKKSYTDNIVKFVPLSLVTAIAMPIIITTTEACIW